MTLTINTKDFSFSPDTLTAIGGEEFCNVLIHPEEKLLLLKPSSRGQKDAINISLPSISGKSFIDKLREVCDWSANATITCDGELCPDGILFKLKEATVDTPVSIFTLFRKHRGRKSHRREKKASFACWNHFKKAIGVEK